LFARVAEAQGTGSKLTGILAGMKVERGTVLWSLPAHVCFGLQNFLIGYTNTLDVDDWAVVGALWFSAGFLGLVASVYFYRQVGMFFFSDDSLLDASLLGDDEPFMITPWVKVVTCVGGAAVGFSQLMMKMSFAMDPPETGPLCAVISSDVVIISTVCHFVYKEYMNRAQAGAILVIVSGLAIMGKASQASTSDGGSVGDAVIAFGIAILGMVGFACAVLSIRVGCLGRLAAWSGFVVRMLVLLVIGAMAFAYSVFTVGWPTLPWNMWLVPIFGGLCQAGGVLCINMALQYPNTGVANAIFASNSVFVLILQAIVFGEFPSTIKLVGMCCVVLGVSSMSLLEDRDEPAVPETPPQLGQTGFGKQVSSSDWQSPKSPAMNPFSSDSARHSLDIFPNGPGRPSKPHPFSPVMSPKISYYDPPRQL
jgi:drug/metabolite transporter (DMT)-like permease